MTYLELIENHIPFDETEARTKAHVVDFYTKHNGDVFTRENTAGHATASAWILNRTHDKVLLAYHIQYESIGWIGGHADGEHDPIATATRELQEETGLAPTDFKLLSDDIFLITDIVVPAHIKRGAPVAEHFHIDLCYLFEADENAPLTNAEGENRDVQWIAFDDIRGALSGEDAITMWPVYERLLEKAHKMFP